LALTVMVAIFPPDPLSVTCPLSARGPAPEVPPTAWRVPVTVPVGPAVLSAMRGDSRLKTPRRSKKRAGSTTVAGCDRFVHAFLAVSGPVMRLMIGNVEAMIASEAASPPMTVTQYPIPGSLNAMST
jgi:hypothetical protein